MTKLTLEEQLAQDFHANPDQSLPSWDVEMYVSCGVLRHNGRHSYPVTTEEETEAIDFGALHDSFSNPSLVETTITKDQGTAKPLFIDVSAVNIDKSQLKGIGVGEDPLLALIDRDKGSGRQLPYELMVPWTAADANDISRDAESLISPMPFHSNEQIILYLHGGGYTGGSPGSHRILVHAISAAVNQRAFSLDYRLAPRHPFPAQLHDAYIAFLYLLNQGFKAENIVLAGDSAGGHLCVSLALLLRHAGCPKPRGVVLLCPWVDLDLQDTETVRANSRYDYLCPHRLEMPTTPVRLFYKPGHRANSAYIEELHDPYVSPIYADFTGFPPTLIQSGEREVIIEGIRTLYQRMKEASAEDASILYEEYADMVHVFHRFPFRPEVYKALASIVRFITSL
ncbi:hypothetical protein EC988_002534 [Linderina pennispora]|nr:hypothetical protein EC988_002534 [Linderina pennispora]